MTTTEEGKRNQWKSKRPRAPSSVCASMALAHSPVQPAIVNFQRRKRPSESGCLGVGSPGIRHGSQIRTRPRFSHGRWLLFRALLWHVPNRGGHGKRSVFLLPGTVSNRRAEGRVRSHTHLRPGRWCLRCFAGDAALLHGESKVSLDHGFGSLWRGSCCCCRRRRRRRRPGLRGETGRGEERLALGCMESVL